ARRGRSPGKDTDFVRRDVGPARRAAFTVSLVCLPAGGSTLSDTTAVPVIVFAPSRDAVEAVNSHLRRAGHAVHCTWIPELGDLGDALTQINPELLVCQPRAAGELSAVSAVRTQLTPEVPLVALLDNADEAAIAAAIAAGARDAVTLARPDRLRAVIE